MSFLSALFGSRRDRTTLAPLYAAVVAGARDPAWYRDGEVPDTVDGRFDMVAALLALVLLRLEAAGAKRESVLLTELFIDDMDASMRQLGTGDLMVGKQVGKLMGALGGRLAAFRDAGDIAAAVSRNIFHDAPPSPEAVTYVAGRLSITRQRLDARDIDRVLAGDIA